MRKRHHNRVHSTESDHTDISIAPEAPRPIEEQIGRAVGTPSYEDIQYRAYLIHQEKGGSDLDNWLEAERLLKEECHH